MNATVYYSQGGLKYHADPTCKRLQGGHDLWDWDCEAWAFTGYAAVPHTAEQAASDGKLPCLACVPAQARVLPSSGETFGHEPVHLRDAIHENWTRHSACLSCRRGETSQVCARCMAFDANGMWRIPAHPIHWPCTSAIVLGLAPRGGAA